MATNAEMPVFGNLAGIRMVVAAISTAAPFAGQLYAENGADVIWIEPPGGVDPYRWTNDGWGPQNEHRNMRNLMLDVVKEEGREVFLKLMETTDVFIEASRGGQWAKWGYTDEVLWERNPKLVIGHMSGYGLTGDPAYVGRPGYDFTINAFSGLMYLNGYDGGDPLLMQRYVTDYYAGLFAYGSSLAAYIHALKTGQGESFDLAQYDAAVRCQAGQFGLWFDKQYQVPRGFGAPRDLLCAGVGYYECKDGEGVYLFANGPGPMKKAIDFFGLEYGSDLFPEGTTAAHLGTPAAPVFDAAVEAYCAEHTAAEVDEAMGRIGVPCSEIMSYRTMENHPHYLARNTWIEWETVDGKTAKGCTAVPRFKNNPQQIWRGCPSQGMDNEDVLADIGIVDEKRIESLYEKGILRKSDYVGGL